MSSENTLERGRVLLSIGDARALPMLREVAARALEESRQNPQNSAQKNDAISAGFWWGNAAQKFGARDEAIEAWTQTLSRAREFASQNSATKFAISPEEATTKNALDAVLRAGFPLELSDETLRNLSVIDGKWTPQTSNFQLDSSLFEYSNLVQNARASLPKLSRELLVTSGILPLFGDNSRNGNSLSWRTPSLYASVDSAKLPPTLRMNRVIYGFARESSTRNWRQKVRVFYASPDAANDEEIRGRAEILCRQLLRVAALFETILGQKNRYARDGVTTLWLSREAAEWPQNAPADAWNAGAWIDSAPDQMILFRASETRSEAEWLREVAHEYSHIALPPFAGFAPPLEPFGNGRLGETLLMSWAAAAPDAFFDAENRAKSRENSEVHGARYALPTLRSWLQTDPRAPISPGGDEREWNLLRGLAIEIERVYGAATLQRALDFAANRNVSANENSATKTNSASANGRIFSDANVLSNLSDTNLNADFSAWRAAGIEYSMRRNSARKSPILRAENLRLAFENAMRFWPKNGDVWPIWLAGAIDSPTRNSLELARRAPLHLAKNARVSLWIYVPLGAKNLRVFVTETKSSTRSAANSTEKLATTSAKQTAFATDSASMSKMAELANVSVTRFTSNVAAKSAGISNSFLSQNSSASVVKTSNENMAIVDATRAAPIPATQIAKSATVSVPTISVLGAWKSENRGGNLVISLAGKSGWQKLELRAARAVDLSGAQFERGASGNASTKLP